MGFSCEWCFAIWFIRRGSGPAGGAYIEGFKDADAEPGHALMLEGTLGEAAHTVDSSAGRGVIEIDARITNGSTGRTAVGSGGNLLAIQTNDTTVAITKGNGDLHLMRSWPGLPGSNSPLPAPRYVSVMDTS